MRFDCTSAGRPVDWIYASRESARRLEEGFATVLDVGNCAGLCRGDVAFCIAAKLCEHTTNLSVDSDRAVQPEQHS